MILNTGHSNSRRDGAGGGGRFGDTVESWTSIFVAGNAGRVAGNRAFCMQRVIVISMEASNDVIREEATMNGSGEVVKVRTQVRTQLIDTALF